MDRRIDAVGGYRYGYYVVFLLVEEGEFHCEPASYDATISATDDHAAQELHVTNAPDDYAFGVPGA